ncbi:hypothetical protein BGZ60DRAFT_528693 [Tricladium varicosporioides]|nr:hypothetical protein BGZ60DRAFT_528693 [Hymenoscyphus varicosporioides]
MSSTHASILACQVKVRKYILVAKPSRWAQKGERVVVHSSMVEIPDGTSHIPVKRCLRGQEQNPVCFLPIQDLEKDSNKIYEDLQISTQPLSSNAHGIALVNSSPDSSFEYRRTDCFWISIGSNTNGFDHSVPVINLRTSKSGTIALQDVCWYPKILGPGGQLWTMGGETRKLKQCGSRKFTYWSWVICQDLDGAPPTTDNKEIPTKDVTLGDRRILSAEESHTLFRKILNSMEERTKGSHRLEVVLPTPPLTPARYHQEAQSPSHTVTSGISSALSEQGGVKMWRRIIEQTRNPNAPYKMLKRSLIHPQRIPDSPDAELRCSPETVQRSETPGIPVAYPIDKIEQYTGTDIVLARCLDTMRHSTVLSRPVGDESTPNQHRSWIQTLPSKADLTDFCDRKDPECQYIYQFHQPHFHSSPEKCIIGPDTADITTTLPSSNTHEHCISRLQPLPDRLGSCMLADLPSRNHKCCYWQPKDIEEWTENDKQVYDTAKAAESRRMSMDIDDNHWINKKPGVELKTVQGRVEELKKMGMEMKNQGYLIQKIQRKQVHDIWLGM